MAKNDITNDTSTTDNQDTVGRKPRKKVYEREQSGVIPDELIAHFKKDNYDLKAVRWAILGDEDYKYLHKREREGYEFVEIKEIPRTMLKGLREVDTRGHAGLVTIGDLCLMKIDCDLRNSRRKYFQNVTDTEYESVGSSAIERKGLITAGSRSRVGYREPTFQD
jgi:hypothetical protein